MDEAYPQVTFSTERDYHFFCWDYATYSRSEPYSAYTAKSGGGAASSVDLTWTFASPVRDLVFYTLGDQTNGRYAKVTVTLEDGSEDTMQLKGDGGATSAEKADLSEWGDIVRIDITEMEDSYSVNYDDISFRQRD